MYYDTIETGSRIAALRRERGLTQEQLAEELNISDRHIRKLESGERGASVDVLVDFSMYFDVSLDYLILGKSQQAEVKKQLRAAIASLSALEAEL